MTANGQEATWVSRVRGDPKESGNPAGLMLIYIIAVFFTEKYLNFGVIYLTYALHIIIIYIRGSNNSEWLMSLES